MGRGAASKNNNNDNAKKTDHDDGVPVKIKSEAKITGQGGGRGIYGTAGQSDLLRRREIIYGKNDGAKRDWHGEGGEWGPRARYDNDDHAIHPPIRREGGLGKERADENGTADDCGAWGASARETK